MCVCVCIYIYILRFENSRLIIHDGGKQAIASEGHPWRRLGGADKYALARVHASFVCVRALLLFTHDLLMPCMCVCVCVCMYNFTKVTARPCLQRQRLETLENVLPSCVM